MFSISGSAMPVSPNPPNSDDIPRTPETTTGGSHCEACGAILKASVRFCEYCGVATFLPLSTWSGVKNLDAHLKTELSAGADRDQVVCGAVQDCFDLIAADESAHVGKIGFHKLHRVIPDAVFEIATNLEWLPWEMQELTDIRIQDWLSNLFGGRIDHFESLDSGRPSGRQYPRPNPVVVPIPKIWLNDESSAPHQRANAAPDLSDTPDPEQVRENIRFIRRAEQADPELQRKRDRRTADLNAVYARHLGRNGPEVQRQESLLNDARSWAKEESRTIIADGVRDVQELKARVVKQTWDKFVPAHAFYPDLRLGYRQFAPALWEEGWPSLDDLATAAIHARAVVRTARSAPIVQARPPRADRAEWAACPRPSDFQSTEQPRLFKTERGANQFLNAKLRNSDGVRFDFARSDQGWLVVPICPGVLASPKPDRAFREFLPIAAVEVSDPPTLDRMLQSVLDDRIVEPSCYLGEAWRFADIEHDARKRVGHAYEGRKHGSVDELVVKAVHDLEKSLFAIHPNAGTSSVASFFGSWQLWRHIAAFCELIGKAPSVRRLDGVPEHARDRVYEQCWVYAHEISTEIRVGENALPSSPHQNSQSEAVPSEPTINPAPEVDRSLSLRHTPQQVPLRNGPAWNRLRQRTAMGQTRRFETDCPLLAQREREKLAARAVRRESEIADLLDSALLRLEARREELGSAPSSPRPGFGAVLDQLKSEFRLEILGVAAGEARDGVREFADGILALQNRLGVHANLLREYTGCLASELRDEVLTSELFRPEPPATWLEDPIAQQAIDTCEEIIAERKATGDTWDYDSDEPARTDFGPWSAVVQEWEYFKAAHKINPGPEAHIAESTFRAFLAARQGVAPHDVTWEQIRLAAARMCRHYGAILLVPLEPTPPPPPPLVSMETSQFWKDREEEFRKHDVGDNGAVVALWYSYDDSWHFRSGVGFSTGRSERLFTTLAREAVKGFTGSGANEPLAYWLTALRREKWAKPEFSGSSTMPESEFELKRASGQAPPPGSMIRFAPTTKEEASATQTSPVAGAKGVTVQRVWNTATAKIEKVFSVSADFCMEMRSRVTSHAGPIQAGKPARHEIKSLAEDTFSVSQDLLITEHGEKKRQVLGQVARTGNSGGHLPALTKWACESLRETILALADAYVEAFTLFGVPADVQAEKDIETSARQMAAGSISGVTGQLALIATRTNRPGNHSGGGHLNREINATMLSALKESRLRLKRQRIEIGNSASPSQQRPTPPGPGHSRPEQLKHLARDPAPSPRLWSVDEAAKELLKYLPRDPAPSPDRRIVGTMDDIQELPTKFQNRFETAKAKAELEYANRAEKFPHHPEFAESPINHIKMIQDVFFAYCAQARDACREGAWSVVKARKSTEAALPLICDHYFVRKHGDRSEENKSTFRTLFTEGAFLDSKGKQHLSELMTLAEGAPTGSQIVTGLNGEPPPVKPHETAAPQRPAMEVPTPEPLPAIPGSRGPKRGYDTALRVAEVIAGVAPGGNWRAKLEDVCDSLDEAKIPRPKTWKAKGYGAWFDCWGGERSLVVKAIEHHLELAKEHRKTFS
jgi:hypothetical protein